MFSIKINWKLENLSAWFICQYILGAFEPLSDGESVKESWVPRSPKQVSISSSETFHLLWLSPTDKCSSTNQCSINKANRLNKYIKQTRSFSNPETTHSSQKSSSRYLDLCNSTISSCNHQVLLPARLFLGWLCFISRFCKLFVTSKKVSCAVTLQFILLSWTCKNVSADEVIQKGV